METDYSEQDAVHPAKLPLPRIATASARSHRTIVSVERARVACDGCRKRRIKCSGNSPTCFQCLDSNNICRYPAARRNRIKELEAQIEQTRESNRQLVKLVGKSSPLPAGKLSDIKTVASGARPDTNALNKPRSNPRTSVYSLLNEPEASSSTSSSSSVSPPSISPPANIRHEALETMFTVLRSGDQTQIAPLIEAIQKSSSPEELAAYMSHRLLATPPNSE